MTMGKALSSILAGVLMGFVTSGNLTAQVPPEELLLLQPSVFFGQQVAGAGSEAYIQQIGSLNEVELMQLNDPGGRGHLAKVLQSGQMNLAIITQNGQENKLTLLQRGDQNTYELINTGQANDLVTFQDGSGNRIVQQLLESNQMQVEFIQIGNNNEILSALQGMQQSGLIIRQTGDGLRAIVNRMSQ